MFTIPFFRYLIFINLSLNNNIIDKNFELRAPFCFIIVIAEFIDNVKYFFQQMTEKGMKFAG